jgi:hypothetical protein
MVLNLSKRNSSSLFDWLLGELIGSFLKNNASQLTIYGYVDLLWHYTTSKFLFLNPHVLRCWVLGSSLYDCF